MSQIVNEQKQLFKEEIALEKKPRKPRQTKKKMPEKSPEKSPENIVENKEPMNEKLVDLMEKLTVLMSKRGDQIRARVYKRAQETILAYPDPITRVSQLKGLSGIGSTIMEKLKEYQETGTLELLEREKNKPEYMLSNIYGIGPIKAKELVEKYDIKTIEELRERQEEVLNVVQKIGLKYYEEIEERIPRSEIDEYNNTFSSIFNKVKEDDSAYEIVGSYRRKLATSGDIDVIITSKNPLVFEKFIDILIEKGIITNVLSRGKTKSLVVAKLPSSKFHRRVDFLYTKHEEYPFAVLYFTGSKGFNTVMRGHALKMGYSLNEHGISKMVDKKKTEQLQNTFDSERDIFDFLGLEYREPEDRKDGRAVIPKSNQKDEKGEPGSQKIVENIDDSINISPKSIPKIEIGELVQMGEPVQPKELGSQKKEENIDKNMDISKTSSPKSIPKEEMRELVQQGKKTRKKREPKEPKVKKSPKKKVPKEPKTRKTKKEILDIFSSKVQNNIYNFFTSDSYDVKNINDNEYTIKAKNNEECLTIKFLSDNIRIEKLSKCGENSGTDLLSKIENLAKSMKNIQYITLLDTSEVKMHDYNIDLAILKILTKGKSWYNQLGYFSSDSENEKIHNAEYVNMKFDKLISSCRNTIKTYFKITKRENIIENIELLENKIKKKNENKNIDNLIKKKEKYLKILDNYDNYIIEEFEKIDNNFESLERKRVKLFPEIDIKITSTKDYFNILVPLIDTAEKSEFLQLLIEIIKPTIKYNRNLVKQLSNYDKITTISPKSNQKEEIGELVQPGYQKTRKARKQKSPKRYIPKEPRTRKVKKEKPEKNKKDKIEKKESIQNELNINQDNKVMTVDTIPNAEIEKTKTHITNFKENGITVLESLNEKELSEMIVLASDKYYNSNNPFMTDNEYDIVKEYIEKKYPKNVEVDLIGAPVKKNKVTLPYEMPSMDKIKPDSNALSNWMNKYKGPYVLSCKLDGVSGMYSTEGTEPKLYTRGDGKVGQDISHLLGVLNLPKEPNMVVRGEFIIPKQVFEEKYKSVFANPRNLVSGIINSKTIDEKSKDLHFVAYEIIQPKMTPSQQLQKLTEMKHEVVLNKSLLSLSNETLSEILVDWRTNYMYEIDGVIVTDDKIYPRISGNPEHAFAFKMVLSDQMGEAKVIDVIWSPSKNGYLKPRVRIEPIRLGGVTIEYATGFNGKFIEDNKIGIGAVVQMIRSGDVIPYIKTVTTPAEKAKMPSVPYTWTSTHIDVILEDIKGDITVLEKNITMFFVELEVDGLSSGNVKRIMEAGYNTVGKILKMSKTDFEKVEGFKTKMIEKIFNGIHEKVDKASLLDIMVASNTFGRGLSRKKMQPMMDEYPDLLTSQDSVEEKVKKLQSIKGIGLENAKGLVNNIPAFMAFLEETGLKGKLSETKDKEENEQPSAIANIVIDTSDPLYGKKIVMTKVRDKEIIEKMGTVGATLEDSVNKNTFAVIVKSKEDDSNKIKKAKELGIPIYTPDEFKMQYMQ
jgi:NAD-dependent DNA ligase